MRLIDIMAASGGFPGNEPVRDSAPLPAAALERIRERMTAYLAPCPFRVGDVVTPLADGTYNGVGEPAIVCQVLAQKILDPAVEAMHLECDMVVLRVARDCVVPFAVASYMYRLWTEEDAS